MADRDEETIAEQSEDRVPAERVLAYLINEGFQKPRVKLGYIAYVGSLATDGADFVVLDIDTETVRHFTMTIEERTDG